MKPMQVSFFRELLETIFERSRALGPAGRGRPHGDMAKLARQLLSRRGELSGVAIAQQIVETYSHSTAPEKAAFFHLLATEFGPDVEKARGAANAFLESGDAAQLSRLGKLAEAPRREFFRRLNLAPGGTAAMVSMRAELLPLAADDPGLKPVDEDLAHLLNTWFNRGFLVLRRIGWSTPANILEKIIQYEAVHEIHDWDDLKRRLDPIDRRCFAFFHPALADEPLIFVEVALTDGGAPSVQALCPRSVRPIRAADDGDLLFDLQLPGRPARHQLRQLPHQAGGHRPGARAAAAQALRHPVAAARLHGLAAAADRGAERLDPTADP
jgi:malonyl-CoA decarboxylase